MPFPCRSEVWRNGEGIKLHGLKGILGDLRMGTGIVLMENALVTCQAWGLCVETFYLHSREEQSEPKKPLCHPRPTSPGFPDTNLSSFKALGHLSRRRHWTKEQMLKACSAWATSSHLDASISSFVNCVTLFLETDACHRVVPLFCECVTSQMPCVCASGSSAVEMFGAGCRSECRSFSRGRQRDSHALKQELQNTSEFFRLQSWFVDLFGTIA